MTTINNPIVLEIADPATADAATAELATVTVDIDTFLEGSVGLKGSDGS